MRILLDTHFLIWLFTDTSKIDKRVLTILSDNGNEIYYSQASLWEISIKYSLGKLSLLGGTPEDFYDAVEKSFLQCSFLKNDDLVSFYKLPKEHKDPFDRIMIWQAIHEDFIFLTVDSKIPIYERYGLKILTV